MGRHQHWDGHTTTNTRTTTHRNTNVLSNRQRLQSYKQPHSTNTQKEMIVMMMMTSDQQHLNMPTVEQHLQNKDCLDVTRTLLTITIIRISNTSLSRLFTPFDPSLFYYTTLRSLLPTAPHHTTQHSTHHNSFSTRLIPYNRRKQNNHSSQLLG